MRKVFAGIVLSAVASLGIGAAVSHADVGVINQPADWSGVTYASDPHQCLFDPATGIGTFRDTLAPCASDVVVADPPVPSAATADSSVISVIDQPATAGGYAWPTDPHTCLTNPDTGVGTYRDTFQPCTTTDIVRTPTVKPAPPACKEYIKVPLYTTKHGRVVFGLLRNWACR